MHFVLGNATGVDITKNEKRRGFFLMFRGWEFTYVHFLEDYIGIGWSRTLTIGKRRWWFTEGWTLWAKKDKRGLMYAFGGKDK